MDLIHDPKLGIIEDTNGHGEVRNELFKTVQRTAELQQLEDEWKASQRTQFMEQFLSSTEGLLEPEIRKKFALINFLIAGCGSVGGPLAEMFVREGGLHITVADPDTVEIKNLNRQPYTYDQVGMKKVDALAATLLGKNPYVEVNAMPWGITELNVEKLVEENAIIFDGIDIEALDRMFLLHYYAQIHRKPVIVGYDLGNTALVKTYRYDQDDNLSPVGGTINEKTLETYRRAKLDLSDGRIERPDFLNIIYSLLSSPVSPFLVPAEFLHYIITKGADSTKTPQRSATAATIAVLALKQIENILEEKRTYHTVKINLDEQTTPDRESVFTRLGLMIRALIELKSRSNNALTKSESQLNLALKDLNLLEP